MAKFDTTDLGRGHGSIFIDKDNTTIWSLAWSDDLNVFVGVDYSSDYGVTWQRWYTFEVGDPQPTFYYTYTIFRDSQGNIYYCTVGYIHRIDNATKVITTVITFTDSAARLQPWGITEDLDGYIYVGEYGTIGPYLHKSIPGGNSFVTINTLVTLYGSHHIHNIQCNPYNGKLYVSMGDSPNRRFLVSSDKLSSFSVIDTRDGHTGLSFTSEAVYVGNDLPPSAGDYVYRSINDAPLQTIWTPPSLYNTEIYYLRACGTDELWLSIYDEMKTSNQKCAFIRLYKSPGLNSPWSYQVLFESQGLDSGYNEADRYTPMMIGANSRAIIPDSSPYVFVQVMDTTGINTPYAYLGRTWRIQRVDDSELFTLIVFGEPTITKSNSTLTTTINIQNLLQNEIPIFQYHNGDNNWINMPTATLITGTIDNGTWQSTQNFANLFGIFTFRCGVQRGSIWYYSNEIQYTISQPSLIVNIESSPTSQSFGAYNINSIGTKYVGFINLQSQNIQTGDIVYLEYSTNQISWTQIQINAIPNNQYCKVNLYANETYYFRFSLLRDTVYYYSNILNSTQFYIEPQFYNLKYIIIPNYSYYYLSCDVNNLYSIDVLGFQYSTDQITWIDLDINYIRGNTYRCEFNLDGKTGKYYYRMKVIRFDETFYSAIYDFDFAEMYPKNVIGYSATAPKSPVNYTSSKLMIPKFGSVRLGYIQEENPNTSVLSAFTLGTKTMGNFIILDIQLKTNIQLTRYWSINIETEMLYDFLRYYSVNTEVDIPFNLIKIDKILKLLTQINPELNLEIQQLQNIEIKCISNPELDFQEIINGEIELTEDMKFQVNLLAR